MQTNNRQQMLTVLAIAGIALFAGDKLLLSPLIDAWKARSESIAHLRSQLTQGKSLLAREKGLRSRWDQMRRNTLPNNTSAAEQQLFKALDSWERDSRVIVTARTPQWKERLRSPAAGAVLRTAATCSSASSRSDSGT